MKQSVTCALMIVGSWMLLAAQSPEHTILTMERRAMDGWLQGNPDGFLDISDPTITYVHDTLETRLGW